MAAYCLCLWLAILFLAAGFVNTQKGSDFFNSLTMIAEGEAGSSLAKLAAGQEQDFGGAEGAEENNFSFAVWSEFGKETVSDGFGQNKYSVDVTAICGSSYCLLPFGKNLSPDDTKGCIIGSKTAEKLFGSHMAEGGEIIWRDRTWIVRGVVQEPADLLMLQASGMTDEISFHRISIALNGEDDRRLTGEKFTGQYGITAKSLRLDYLYGIGWMKEMVPRKWSDFSGWEQNLGEYREAVGYAQRVEKSTIEAKGLEYKEKGRRYSLLGVVCLLLTPCLHVTFDTK